MGKVMVDITMSLDGFVAGPHDGPELPLGKGGERLHQWVYDLASWRGRHGLEGGETSRDSEILERAMSSTGSIVLGRRMFDNAHGWGDDPPFHVPVFVLTHEVREQLAKEGGTTFTFVTDGIESALRQAQAEAGERNVSIAGGAETIQQYLMAGLVDELQIHLAPLVLGGGIRLLEGLDGGEIELEQTGVIESPAVTHLSFRVLK
jgi:dihydrofolate reductase